MSKAGLGARRPAGPGRRAKHAARDAMAFLVDIIPTAQTPDSPGVPKRWIL